MLVLERAQRAERTHFGHAPGVKHLDAIVVPERIDHGRRAGRAANHGTAQGRKFQAGRLEVAEQHLPHRRHTRRVRDFFRLDQLIHRLAVQRRARKHQLGAGQRRGVWNAPCVDMKHRHHGQDGIARRHAHDIRQGRRVRVQDGRTVAVQRGLGVACGAAGVAHA